MALAKPDAAAGRAMEAKNAIGHATLLRFLARRSFIAAEVAQAAETELGPNHSGPSVIDWLVRKAGVTEQRVAEWLAEGLQLPFVDLAAVALDPAVSSLVREELATQHHL